MGGIKRESAIVFRGGRRRFFTLNAACLAEARETIRERLRRDGEDHMPEEWYRPRVNKLAGIYKAQYRRISALTQAQDTTGEDAT
jgi:hypothetical protein